MKQLTGLEALFLHGETPRQAMNLTMVGRYDGSANPFGPVDLAYVLDYARERAARSPLMRRKLTHLPLDADHPYWTEDPDFAVENHVFHSVLPPPGSPAQLDAEVARIHALPIGRARPLWQWWFIEGIDQDGSASRAFAMVFKLHQAAFDAAAAEAMMALAHDHDAPGPPPSRLMSMDDAAPRPAAPGVGALMELSYAKALSAPFRLLETAFGAAQAMMEGARRDPVAAGRLVGAPPATPFNRALSGGRVHGRARISRAQLEAVRARAPGASDQQMALAVIGGAVRRYLGRHGQLPKASLVAGIPAAGTPEGGLTLLPLWTDLADPGARLSLLQSWMREPGASGGGPPAHHLGRTIDFIPGLAMRAVALAFTELRMADTAPPACNLVVLNAPALRGPLFFAQSRMIDHEALGPIWDGAGLLHVVSRFDEAVSVSFVADATLVPDPAFYRDCLEAAIAELGGASGYGPGATDMAAGKI